MRSLRIIQVLSKICRIVCLIIFICTIVGLVGCVVALPIISAVSGVEVDGKTFEQMLLEEGINLNSLYVYLSIGIFSCCVTGFLAKFNELFFKREIADGTPFTARAVKDARRTAIVDIAVSFGAGVLVAIAVGVCKRMVPGFIGGKDYAGFSGVGFGIFLLIVSLFVEYHLEDKAQIKEKEETISKEDYLE